MLIHSFVFYRAQLADNEGTVATRDYETIYTISGSSSPSDIFPVLYLSESPPKYEEKASRTNDGYSSSSSCISLATSDTSS